MTDYPQDGMGGSDLSVMKGMHLVVDDDGILHVTPEHFNALATFCTFGSDVVFHEPARYVPDTIPEAWARHD